MALLPHSGYLHGFIEGILHAHGLEALGDLARHLAGAARLGRIANSLRTTWLPRNAQGEFMTLVYFDTNVYSHIARCHQADAARRLCDQRKWRVLASAANLFETYAIPDADARALEIETLTRVAAEFEKYPRSYLEADDLYRAIMRHRPQWIRQFVYGRQAKSHLAAHNQRWKDAQRGALPTPAAFAAYHRVSEDGVAPSVEFQKALRAARLTGLSATLVSQFGHEVGLIASDLTHPEATWRAVSYSTFESALLRQAAQTRDMADWLRPRLRIESISAGDFFVLWMRDIELTEVRRSAWIGHVAFYQLGHRVSHGNAGDLEHSAMALDVDVFVTADRGLHHALCEASEIFPRPVAHCVLWQRSSPSALDALQEAIAAIK
jgi:hypothetical protein